MLWIFVTCLLLLRCTNGFTSWFLTYSSELSLRASKIPLGSRNVDDLRSEIDEYFNTRLKMNLPPLQENDAGSKAMEMFRPSGWYKDKQAEDLKSRIDTRMPTKLHPLSYIELERHNFKHLVEPIMQLGGPLVVGQKLGIEWVEPPRPKIVSNTTGSSRAEKIFPLDIRGSLSLGSAFEDRLEAAAELDLEGLKIKLDNDESNLNTELSDATGEDYATFKSKKTIKSKRFQVDLPPEGERFTLNYPQRTYFISNVGFYVIAHGHASQDIIEKHILGDTSPLLIQFAGNLSFFFLLSSLLSSVLSFILSKNKFRDPFLWSVKGLLGGPLILTSLNQLPSLGSPLQNSTAVDAK